jgi:hypothetical protein
MTRRKRHPIQVRKYAKGQTHHGGPQVGKITGNFGHHEVVETIKRTLQSQAIGNFNPVFCQYKGKEHLVHSEEGDISDPFRATEAYLKTLFITL